MAETDLHNIGCGILSPSFMKTLCALLIGVLVLHLQCDGSCLAESFSSTVDATPAGMEPPCHKPADVPSDIPQPSHEGNSACSQGPLIESKVSASGKTALQLAAVLPATVGVIALNDPFVPGFTPENLPSVWSPLIPPSILRI